MDYIKPKSHDVITDFKLAKDMNHSLKSRIVSEDTMKRKDTEKEIGFHIRGKIKKGRPNNYVDMNEYGEDDFETSSHKKKYKVDVDNKRHHQFDTLNHDDGYRVHKEHKRVSGPSLNRRKRTYGDKNGYEEEEYEYEERHADRTMGDVRKNIKNANYGRLSSIDTLKQNDGIRVRGGYNRPGVSKIDPRNMKSVFHSEDNDSLQTTERFQNIANRQNKMGSIKRRGHHDSNFASTSNIDTNHYHNRARVALNRSNRNHIPEHESTKSDYFDNFRIKPRIQTSDVRRKYDSNSRNGKSEYGEKSLKYQPKKKITMTHKQLQSRNIEA